MVPQHRLPLAYVLKEILRSHRPYSYGGARQGLRGRPNQYGRVDRNRGPCQDACMSRNIAEAARLLGPPVTQFPGDALTRRQKQKRERCVKSLKKTGRSKGSAFAICTASVTKKTKRRKKSK